MTGEPNIPNADQALQALRTMDKTGQTLSVYLDTSPSRITGHAYFLTYLAKCKSLRRSLSKPDLAAFAAASEQVEAFIRTSPPVRAPGLALFAPTRPEDLVAATLPRSPIDSVSWGASPKIAPLATMLDEYERIAVALVDKARTRIYTVFLGQVEERQEFEDAVPGKQATGDWFALAQTRYARHHEEHVRRHIAQTIDELMDLLKTRPYDRLLIGGPPKAIAHLRDQLPGPLRARLAGTLDVGLFATEAQVLANALQAAETAERRSELEEVNQLIDVRCSPHAALGVDATLSALADGRVHALFVADPFVGLGGECPSCGYLVQFGAQCPRCDAPPVMIRDLRERIIERALEQGARVEVVSGEAGALLCAHGLIGAWTRY
jgi:hypothetical protein